MNRNILPCLLYKNARVALLYSIFVIASSVGAQQDQQQLQQLQQLQAQQPQQVPQPTEPRPGLTIAAIARSYAAGLKRSGVKRMYIEDFRDPNGKVTPFGAWLAVQFASAPGNPWAPIEVIDRNKIASKLKLQDNPETIELTAEQASKLSASLKADTVTGSYGAAENGIGITLKQSSPEHSSFDSTKIAMNDEIRSHLPAPLESLVPSDGIFNAEEGGVPNPRCQVCPSPPFSKDAAKRRVQGAVELSVIITPAGQIANISIEKKLDADLDKIAFDTVSKWTFAPPVNVDRKPITLRAPIAVRFWLDR